MIKRFFVLFLALGLTLSSCGKAENDENDEEQVETGGLIELDEVNYKVLKNYFVNNTFQGWVNPKIESQEEFNLIFSPAPLSGEDGAPTQVDFDNEYVIAVVKPETDLETSLQPIALQKDDNHNVFFTYKITTGEEQTFTTVPMLVIVVDKANNGKVILNELE